MIIKLSNSFLRTIDLNLTNALTQPNLNYLP